VSAQLEGRVSFVVPTRDAARTLRSCLESIRRQQYADVEVVVVDNGSRDATFAIAAELADIVAIGGPERGAQRNLGAALATGEVLVFADADMVFEPEVAREVHAQLARDERCGAVVIPELAFGTGFWARCRVLEKELYLDDPAVEAARGVRANDFATVGGYDESFVGGEDWDLADRVAEVAGEVTRTEARVWHDEGRIRLGVTFRKKRYYGRGLATYVERERRRPLGRRALHRPAQLARRPLLAAGLAVLKAVELAGATCGVVDERRARRKADR